MFVLLHNLELPAYKIVIFATSVILGLVWVDFNGMVCGNCLDANFWASSTKNDWVMAG